MVRCIPTGLTAGIILLAFAAVPPMSPGSATMSFSGSAQAEKAPKTNAINLNSSRSNVNRMGGGGGTKGGTTSGKKQRNAKTPKGNQLNPQPEPPGRTR